MTFEKGKSGNPAGRPPGLVGMKPRWPWREFLTQDEADILARCEKVKAEWKALGALRTTITNRGIQRAKAALGGYPPRPQPEIVGHLDGEIYAVTRETGTVSQSESRPSSSEVPRPQRD